MMDEKKYLYQVVCCHNPEHVFTLVSDFPLRTDGAHKQETYCARCDAFVHVTVQTDLTHRQNVTPESTAP
jgi:hypothetical protein